MSPIADPEGYESDTGQRDNPTCENFRTDTPVLKTIAVTSHNFKALNREGRAICRIFGIPNKRVAKAVYSPPDVVSEDYDRVRDPDFAKYFPPLPGFESGSESPLTEMDSEDEKTVATVKKPRLNNYTFDKNTTQPPHHPLPHRQALSAFLENVLRVDLSQHHTLLVTRGFTLPRLKIIACWPEAAIKEGLKRALLVGCEFTVEREGGRTGMSAFEIVTLEFGLRQLKQQSLVSIPPSTLSTGTTLTSFLHTVMGLDLTSHHDFLETQGFDVQRLTLMGRTWETEDLRETLRRALYIPGGMSALEILVLEFAVRGCES